jgi:mRNA interferase MazF
MKQYPQRGHVYWTNLDPTIGSEITKTRPALIISNDIANAFSSRVIIAPITSKTSKIFPFEVAIEINSKKGKILLDQIRSIDKSRLGKMIAMLSEEVMLEVNEALKISLALE